MKKTEWFPHSIKPARPGVYERDYGIVDDQEQYPEYQYWDGNDWYYGCDSPGETFAMYLSSQVNFGKYDICYMERSWRGVQK